MFNVDVPASHHGIACMPLLPAKPIALARMRAHEWMVFALHRFVPEDCDVQQSAPIFVRGKNVLLVRSSSHELDLLSAKHSGYGGILRDQHVKVVAVLKQPPHAVSGHVGFLTLQFFLRSCRLRMNFTSCGGGGGSSSSGGGSSSTRGGGSSSGGGSSQ